VNHHQWKEARAAPAPGLSPRQSTCSRGPPEAVSLPHPTPEPERGPQLVTRGLSAVPTTPCEKGLRSSLPHPPPTPFTHAGPVEKSRLAILCGRGSQLKTPGSNMHGWYRVGHCVVSPRLSRARMVRMGRLGHAQVIVYSTVLGQCIAPVRGTTNTHLSVGLARASALASLSGCFPRSILYQLPVDNQEWRVNCQVLTPRFIYIGRRYIIRAPGESLHC
jgi:hypothetical protein